MPELPEVETVRRQLAPLLEGALLEEIVIWESDKETPKGDQFSKSLRGRQVKTIDRRGKLLLWRLDDGSALLVHLKMTGKLLKRATLPTAEERHKHDRLAFIIARGTQRSVLVWNDVRRFGYLKHVTDPAFDEGHGRTAGTGIQNWNVAIELLDEVDALGLVSAETLVRPCPSREVVPSRAARNNGIAQSCKGCSSSGMGGIGLFRVFTRAALPPRIRVRRSRGRVRRSFA